MKAVFESKQPFLTISRGELHSFPVYGERYNHKTGEYKRTKEVVSRGLPAEYLSSPINFTEGAARNRVTLTDAKEIGLMRAYIYRRKDDLIKEVK